MFWEIRLRREIHTFFSNTILLHVLLIYKWFFFLFHFIYLILPNHTVCLNCLNRAILIKTQNQQQGNHSLAKV